MRIKEIFNQVLQSKLLKRFLGFSTVGFVVTLFSFFLIVFFNEIIKLNVYLSYVLSYTLSILLSYFLNLKYVFKSKFNFKSLVLFFSTYLLSMLLGLLILKFFNYFLVSWNKSLLTYMVLPFTVLFNFFVISRILKKDKLHTAQNHTIC